LGLSVVYGFLVNNRLGRVLSFSVKSLSIISFTLYPAYISSVVIVGFLFNKSSLNLYFLVVQGLVLYLSLG
ncbi:uncharacterized protein METZ01_LOCUS251049, partial [marine metagenome]